MDFMEQKILVEVSARHVHLTQEHVEVLFGKGAVLEPRKELTTPGLFACKQRVDVVGPKGMLHGVTILAPIRKYTQIELSKTDARVLGIDVPIRMSGDLEGTPGCTLVGPAGSLELDKGLIVAHRHVHLPTAVAEEWGVKKDDVVALEVNDDGRDLILKNVFVRLSTSAGPFVHIDTDEGNAAGIAGKTYGKLIRV